MEVCCTNGENNEKFSFGVNHGRAKFLTDAFFTLFLSRQLEWSSEIHATNYVRKIGATDEASAWLLLYLPFSR